MSMQSVLTQAVTFTLGAITLAFWSVVATWHGYLWQERSKREKKAVAEAQHNLWSLDHPGGTGHDFSHGFLPIREGLQLHFLTTLTPLRKREAPLIVFLHGFPDSCHIFTHYLAAPLAEHAYLVSLDLPGFGGSDGLPTYSADEMLNALVKAIEMLKERYLDDSEVHDAVERCVLVGHDWGGALASRLAVETCGLIDRVVIVNAPVLAIFRANMAAGVSSCTANLEAWWLDWRNTKALHDALDAIRPVIAQVVKSNYIFMFGLPMVILKRLHFVKQYLVSFCHRPALKSRFAAQASWSQACSIGPSVNECADTGRKLPYGRSVAERAMQHPQGDWDARIRLYREGLAYDDWTLRPTSGVDNGVRQVQKHEPRGFQCPASIVFGLQDLALDYRTCVKGVQSLWQPGTGAAGKGKKASSIVLMEDCGHWSILEETGVSVIRGLLLEIVGVVAHDELKGIAGVRREDVVAAGA